MQAVLVVLLGLTVILLCLLVETIVLNSEKPPVSQRFLQITVRGTLVLTILANLYYAGTILGFGG